MRDRVRIAGKWARAPCSCRVNATLRPDTRQLLLWTRRSSRAALRGRCRFAREAVARETAFLGRSAASLERHYHASASARFGEVRQRTLNRHLLGHILGGSQP
jgi:hypothetical protein